MKKIIILALLAHSPLFAVDPYDGKEFKMRQTLQNVDITGTANDALDISGGAMIDGQLTVGGTTTLKGSAFSVGGSTLVVTQGKVGIGTNAPSYSMDIYDGGIGLVFGGDSNATTRTANTNKFARMAIPHYSSQYEEPVVLAFGSSASGENILNLGGGTSSGNSVTALKFFTGASTFTLTGTQRMGIDYQGFVGIGTTAPQTKLHMSSGTLTIDGNGTTDINTRNQGWAEGYARGVYATNRAGAAISSGTIVMQIANASYAISVTTAAANTEAPVGTVYDVAGCADGAICRICTEGICPVRLEAASNCTVSHDLVVTGDEDGRAECKTGTAAEHNQEVGQPASFSTPNGAVINMWAHRN